MCAGLPAGTPGQQQAPVRRCRRSWRRSVVANVACRSEGPQQPAREAARSPAGLAAFSFVLARSHHEPIARARARASDAARPVRRGGGVGASGPIVCRLRMIDAWTLYRVGCTCMHEYILYIVLILSFVVLIYRGYAIQNDWYRPAMVRERTGAPAVRRRSTIDSAVPDGRITG